MNKTLGWPFANMLEHPLRLIIALPLLVILYVVMALIVALKGW